MLVSALSGGSMELFAGQPGQIGDRVRDIRLRGLNPSSWSPPPRYIIAEVGGKVAVSSQPSGEPVCDSRGDPILLNPGALFKI